MSLITITGPTGSGKTSLARKLEKFGIKELVSTTTRPSRSEEIHGDHYFFLTPAQFELEPLVESIQYGPYKYGLSAAEVSKAKGRDCCVVLTPEGLKQTAQYCQIYEIPILMVYISAPLDVLVKRLLDRGAADTAKRIDAACAEFREWPLAAGYHRAYHNNTTPLYAQEIIEEIEQWCYDAKHIME